MIQAVYYKDIHMTAKVYAAVLSGLDARIVEVEAGMLKGLSAFHIVGLADKSVDESRQRLTLALKSVSAKPPLRFNAKTIINLAPADEKKEGALLDLPIALSFLAVSKQSVVPDKNTIFIGELGLDGALRKVTGALPLIMGAKKHGFKKIVLPEENAAEVKYIEGIDIYPEKNLKGVLRLLEEKFSDKPLKIEKFSPPLRAIDLSYIALPDMLWRAIFIAAAGRHNMLLFGPPGTGKSLIAQHVADLLPPLTLQEAIEVSSIHSITGLLPEMITHPVMRNPHHSASAVSVLGGGNNPGPGEISLAHKGVLFLDEFPEFRRDVLEGLREPLESSKMAISRARKKVIFPAEFLLVGAYNPCPCGFYQDPEKECTCSPADINRYHKKLSGPILDRMDMHIVIPRVKSALWFDEHKKMPELPNIMHIQKIQLERQGTYNSRIHPKDLQRVCFIEKDAEDMLTSAADALQLSLRAVHKVMRVARTLADMEGCSRIEQGHIAESLQYRNQDKS